MCSMPPPPFWIRGGCGHKEMNINVYKNVPVLWFWPCIGSSAQKGEMAQNSNNKNNKTKKSSFGEALFLTPLLVVVTINVFKASIILCPPLLKILEPPLVMEEEGDL